MTQFKTKCSIHGDVKLSVYEDYHDISQDYHESYVRCLCIDMLEDDTEQGTLMWLDKSETERLVAYLQSQLKDWK